MNGHTLITPPAIEPVTLTELREFCRVGTVSVEPPAAAPIVAMASPAAPGSVTAGVHQYLVTFITADEETTPGDVSALITVADELVNGQVVVTLPLGSASVIARNIYRTEAGGTVFKLVGTVDDNDTTTYTDNIADASLGLPVPTVTDHTDQLLRQLLRTAREHLEDISGLAFITQTWDLFLDAFPSCNVIELPHTPLQSVTAVYSVADDDTETVFASTNYHVDTARKPGRIVLKSAYFWPYTATPFLRTANAVRIRYVAGFGDGAGDVLERLRSAIKFLVDWWFRYPENVGEVPSHISALVAPLRMF